jgi:hypothetical protein
MNNKAAQEGRGALGAQWNTGGIGYEAIPPKGMLIRFFDHFMLNYGDFRHLSRVFHAFRALWTQGNTVGIGLEAIPSNWYVNSIF